MVKRFWRKFNWERSDRKMGFWLNFGKRREKKKAKKVGCSVGGEERKFAKIRVRAGGRVGRKGVKLE